MEGVTRWAGLLDALVTLLALAQIPEEKWGGESHNCPPPCKIPPHFMILGLMGRRLGSPEISQGWGLPLWGKSRECGVRRASPTLAVL